MIYFEDRMKSIKHIKEKVTDFENLHGAYRRACKGKKYEKEIQRFSLNLEDNLHSLRDELLSQTFDPGPYYETVIHDPVDRLIMWQSFRTRVVQMALYRVINPEFSRGYIDDSYACIKNKGTERAGHRLYYFMQQVGRKERTAASKGDNTKYYILKFDTSKYFYRIDHEVALNLLGKKVNFDSWTMWLLDLFINTPGAKFGFPPGLGVKDVPKEQRLADKGLAPGSVINQLVANIVQNELDHYCKRVLQIRPYLRYMDDGVAIGTLEQVKDWEEKISNFMKEKLKLDLNPKKTFIVPIWAGVDFCQFRVYPDTIKLKKATAIRMKHNLKRVQKCYANGEMTLERAAQTVNSYNSGLLSHCDSYHLRRRIFGEYTGKEQTEGWFFLQRNNDNQQ